MQLANAHHEITTENDTPFEHHMSKKGTSKCLNMFTSAKKKQLLYRRNSLTRHSSFGTPATPRDMASCSRRIAGMMKTWGTPLVHIGSHQACQASQSSSKTLLVTHVQAVRAASAATAIERSKLQITAWAWARARAWARAWTRDTEMI